MAANTTLPFACWNWGITRSQICSASFSSSALYLATAPRIAIRPHSVHSPRAINSRERVCESRMKMGSSSAASWISVSAATAFATTCEQQRESGQLDGTHTLNCGLPAHHRIAVGHHVLQHFDESVLDSETRFHVVEFHDSKSSGFPDVRILVAQAFPQGVGDVIEDLLRPQAAHRSDRQRADQRVRVLRILLKK